MPLKHLVFTIEQENRYYKENPGIHVVKWVVDNSSTGDPNKKLHHILVSDNKRMNGMHMQPGGAKND
jgi:hypothetical protein